MSKIEDKVCENVKLLDGIDDVLKTKICSAIQVRAKVGKAKYGVTLERDDLSESQWLTHLQEELLDAVNYATRIQSISDAHEEEVLFHELKGPPGLVIVCAFKMFEILNRIFPSGGAHHLLHC